MTEVQINRFASISKFTSEDKRVECPICLQATSNISDIALHLANHMENIATFSLPIDLDSVEYAPPKSVKTDPKAGSNKHEIDTETPILLDRPREESGISSNDEEFLSQDKPAAHPSPMSSTQKSTLKPPQAGKGQTSRLFKNLRAAISRKKNVRLCEEIKQALYSESLQPEIERSDLFVTAQSCKDVWEAYRRNHKMSFLQLIAKEMKWSQDSKRRIHKDGLNTLSALVWLVNDWKSFVKLIRLFRLEEQEFTIFEDINFRAHTNIKAFDEIIDIRLSDSNKRHSPFEIYDDIERAQQIFFPVQILPMSDIPQKLPAGRRMPFLKVARIYPPKANRSGLSTEKSVARMKVADGYLPPLSRMNSVVGSSPR